MARASTPTLLSTDRWSAMLGVNPSHFNGAATGTAMAVTRNTCQDIWHQYSWQAADRVSREDLARNIADAEADIARAVGWWPAPMWTSEDVQPFPKHHRPEVLSAESLDTRGYYQCVRARWGHVIAPGRREVVPVGTPNVVLSSADDDLLNETATVTVATALTDAREVKVYFAGHGGAREWEIRPARTKVLAAGNFTATFWAWQLIEPALWEALPTTDDPAAIDWSDADNIVDTVDVYREYNDTTAISSQFMWEPTACNLPIVCSCGGTGCAACQMTTQDGCLHVRDARGGMVVPQAGSYDEEAEQWASQCFAVCRDPDMVKLWYYSGLIADEYLAGTSYDPLSNWMAQCIAWIATARLERPLCSCSNVRGLAEDWRKDLALVGEGGSMLSPGALDNPFGTRKGEVKAWERLSKLAPRRGKVALV